MGPWDPWDRESLGLWDPCSFLQVWGGIWRGGGMAVWGFGTPGPSQLGAMGTSYSCLQMWGRGGTGGGGLTPAWAP